MKEGAGKREAHLLHYTGSILLQALEDFEDDRKYQ